MHRIDRLAGIPLRHVVRGIAASLLLAPLASPARAATLDVPATHATIRAAVAAAATGDTILVAPGVHSGGVWINGKSLTIASRYATTGDTTAIAQTTLNGVATGACGGAPGCIGNAVLEFGDDAHGSAIVGLTIANGENGIASASTLDVNRCRVIGNGDGVDYVVGAGGSIRNSLFENNVDDGIDLNGRTDLVIRDNVIRNNQDDGIEFRLYAYNGGPSEVDIIGNRITGNGEDGIQIIDYPGAGNYVLRIERNLFQSNFNASGLSAAIGIMPNGETLENLVGAPSPKRMLVIHNTFIGEKNGVVGGANTIVLNNIFTGIEGTALRRVGGNSIAAYSLFWNNGTHHFETTVDAAHQVLAAPLLDATGVPTAPSPAINAGTAFYQWQGETVLDVPAASYDGSAPDLGAFETSFNVAPQVSAGPDRLVVLTTDVVEMGPADILTTHPIRPTLVGSATLAGAVSDDGLPYPPALSMLWSVVSGPGPVSFSDPRTATPLTTFYLAGTYFLRLTASDGLLASFDVVKVTVRPPFNQIPAVDAGPAQTLHLPDAAILTGTTSDDDLPVFPGGLTLAWSKVSGPGPVTLDTPTLVSTRATFTTVGTYAFRLSANDGEFEVADTTTVTVLPVVNRAPVVSAGADQTLMIPSDAHLDGTVTDDGLPGPPSTITTSWSVVSGPGAVTFGDASLVDTQAGFTVAGAYRLRLAASDGALIGDDTVMVIVQPPPPPIERRIVAGSDDAEERSDGHIVRKTVGLDLVYDGGNQTVGLRFTSVAVPLGATIIAATLQFEAEAVQSDAADLVIRGQASDSPSTFTYADFNVSGRPRTAAFAPWSPPPWTVVGEAGAAQRTSDLRAVVQEIVDRPGWESGNAMAFIITGTGRRTARTFEADAPGAALLHIEFGGLVPPSGPAPSGVTETNAATRQGSLLEPEGSIAKDSTSLPAVGLEHAILGLSPQPSRGVLRVDFSLAGEGPALIELVDIAGRRVAGQAVDAARPGRQALELRRRLPAGIYLVRLIQGPRAVTKKAIVLE